MAGRTTHYYLLKLLRLTGWLLLPLMLLFVVTGFSMAGKYGFNKLVGPQYSLAVHKSFDLPIVVLFLAHSLLGVYLSLRRWGWIGRKTTT